MIHEQPHDLQLDLRRDERARQEFVSSLRAHVLGPVADHLRAHYERRRLPEFEDRHGRAPESGPEVHRLLKDDRPFRFYSAVRCNAQEMVFASVIPAVERKADDLSVEARALREDRQRAGGSLHLDPELAVPRNVTEIDVHLAPGSYHSEYGDDDVSAGAIYDHAINVFAFNQMGRHLDDIGSTMANYVRLAYPDFRPRKILDCGCSVGHNTVPWARAFPDAEVHAIDVAPGMLRYASARAQSLGVPVHFHQMDARETSFEDASFDVVFSSMFLHELPRRDIDAFFREAFRLLRPGGLLWNMELPPNAAMGAFESFYLDWDSYYNNEPFYKPFRDQDYRALCARAGFRAEDFREATLPRYTFVGEEAFAAELDGPRRFDANTGRMTPRGTRWYGFGSWKAAREGEGA